MAPAAALPILDAHPAANQTDVGNASRLVALFGQDIAYCPPLGAWLVWDGQVWEVDEDDLRLLQLTKRTVRAMLAEAADLSHDGARQSLAAHALHTESAARLKDMIFLARDERIVSAEQFDADPWLLACQNGTLDLHSGALRPHCREDYLTHLIPVAYDPEATCPTWDAFLARILPDPETRSFVQKAIGYSLTGLTTEQCLFFMYGIGQNGKTTFINILMKLFGSFAETARIETFMEMTRNQSGSAATPDLAALRGARLVVPGEVKKGHKLNESRIKDMTGSDPIRCRDLYQKRGFTYQPQFTLWLFGNYKPKIIGQDNGIWRRQRLIPFTQIIGAEERDDALPAKLKAELPGILAWAVRGCLAWQQEGLGMPPEVAGATAAFRTEMDPLGDFLAACCYHAPDARVSRNALWQEYERWVRAEGEQVFDTAAKLTRELRTRHYGDEKSGNQRFWVGLGLKKDQPKPTPPPAPEPDRAQEPEAAFADANDMPPCYRCGKEADNWTEAGQPICQECLMAENELHIYLRRKTSPDEGDAPAYADIPHAKWFGDVPDEIGQAAWTQLQRWVKRSFPDCHLQRTPVETGMSLVEHTLPWAQGGAPYQYPVLDSDLAKLVAQHTTQHRVEALGEPGRSIEQLVLYDARVAHAAHLRRLPVAFPGQIVHDQANEFVPYRPGRYQVDVTVPKGWAHIGLAPYRGAHGWRWPNRPGETFVTWLDYQEVALLEACHWRYRIRERLLFAPGSAPGSDPLRTFQEHCITSLERLERMQQSPVVKALRAGLRAVVLHTIGNFNRTTRQNPTFYNSLGDVPDDLPPWAELERAPDARYVVKTPERLNPYFARWYRPEWAAAIWAATRVETTKKALLLPPEQVLAIDGDGLYLATDPKWADTGKVGCYRHQGTWTFDPRLLPSHDNQLAWLRSVKFS